MFVTPIVNVTFNILLLQCIGAREGACVVSRRIAMSVHVSFEFFLFIEVMSRGWIVIYPFIDKHSQATNTCIL